MSKINLPRNAFIGFKVNEHLKSALVEIAEAKGQSMTAFIEEIIKEELRRQGVVIEVTTKIV